MVINHFKMGIITSTGLMLYHQFAIPSDAQLEIQNTDPGSLQTLQVQTHLVILHIFNKAGSKYD
jgi:hypothetical protein